MSSQTELDSRIVAIVEVIRAIPQGAVVALLGVIVMLLGAIDAELLGIQADAIRDGWRIVFGIAGAILFLVGIWLIWQERKLPPPPPGLRDTMAEPPSMVRQAPEDDHKTIPVTTSLGKMHRDGVDFLGSVEPGNPETGVWIVSQRVRRKKRVGERPRTERMNRKFPYKATVGAGGNWSCRVPFIMWEKDEEVEFKVWALVPTADVQALFEHHLANRREFAKTEEVINQARSSGCTIDWPRPWVPLPDDYRPSSLIETKPVTVVLTRVAP